MDARVTELHCIMPIGNITSVQQNGILSHELAAKLPHHSVAMQVIQDKRDQKSVPGGLKLHQYANLYSTPVTRCCSSGGTKTSAS